MRGVGRCLVWQLVLVCAVFCSRSSAASKGDWVVLFRSDDPMIWNQEAGKPSDANGFATHVDKAPGDTQFLRLKRMDTGEAVIIPMQKGQISRANSISDNIWWIVTIHRGPAGNGNKLLGISRNDWPTDQKTQQLVRRADRKMDKGYRGWGFSKAASPDQAQTYSWAGESIDKTIFEIAVKGSALSDDEKRSLIDDKPGAAAKTPADATPAPEISDDDKGVRRRSFRGGNRRSMRCMCGSNPRGRCWGFRRS